MDQKTRDMVKQTLARYGASLSDDGYIVSPKQKTGIKITVKGKRLRFGDESMTYGSGPIAPSAISMFVERFWYWKPSA